MHVDVGRDDRVSETPPDIYDLNLPMFQTLL
jgi:hypothetical protein